MRRLITIAALVALAGCGGDDEGLAGAEERALRGHVAQVREAVEAGDRAAAERALRSFRTRVARLRRDGSLTDDEARSLTRGANRALERVAVELPAPAPPPVAEAEPQPPADEEADDDDEGKGKGKGRGKKGKDD